MVLDNDYFFQYLSYDLYKFNKDNDEDVQLTLSQTSREKKIDNKIKKNLNKFE